ncbi:MAG: hypothetical protein LBO09_04155, partial [Candidatus Peribacteria bacterium]|nr:hypothetical protein [Candidatus Peribacteria bacterium]
IYETQKQLKSRQKSDQLSADIFVGHRTGVKGFEDIKYGNKHLKYDFVAPEGKLDLMYTDSKGNILNQKSETYFEFDLENYEAQLAELKPFIKDLNGKKTLIENQNIVNDYFLHLNEELFGEEASKNGKRITLIQHYLSAEQSLIASKTLSFLTTSLLYSDPQQSELQKLLIDYFTQQDNTGENNDIYIPIFKQAYEARKKSDLRKLLLYFLKKQDNNISSHLERIADEPTIIAELKTIDQRLTYESMEVESIIGKEKFSDLYLPQQITKEGNEGVSYEVETLLKDIL